MTRPLKDKPALIIALVMTAALMASCTVTQNVTDTKDMSYIYNPARNVYTPFVSVYNEGEGSSLMTVSIRRGELYFTEANAEGVAMASVLVSVRLFDNTLGGVLADTATFKYDIKKADMGGEYSFQISLDTREGSAYTAEIKIIDLIKADLANAERNLKRQRELFAQKFISQTALDTSQNQVDSLRAQVTADLAAAESSRVTRGYGEIVAPIAGRIGIVAVYPGSLVQPSGPALVSITQIDPINISFTVPERELPALQQALAGGEVAVTAQLDESGKNTRQGRLVFIDNSVDSSSGTVRLKATFKNDDSRLWPGMFVGVSLSPRTLAGVLTVPAQAVQTGPERKFLYAIGAEGKVTPVPVRVQLIQDGRAVIDGADAGTKVVLEGAQNLRPGSSVTETPPNSPNLPNTPGGGKGQGKGQGKQKQS